MKTCPYCAEEIRDEAIKCRYCQSWLVDEHPASADRAPAAAAATGAAPEPQPHPERQPEPDTASPAWSQTTPGSATTPVTQPTAIQPEQVAFTHSGERFLLGYAGDYFGIWDRQSPATAAFRFPRNDQGWRDAWAKYVSIETNFMEVK